MNHHASHLRIADPTADSHTDLQTVVDAWREATLASERTTAALQAEVRRLRAELASCSTLSFADSDAQFLAQLAVDAVYQLRASLGPAALDLRLLRRRLQGDATAIELLRKLESMVSHLDAATDDYLQFAAAGESEMQDIPLRALIDEVHDTVAERCAKLRVRTIVDVPSHVRLVGDYDLLRRAVCKLMLNALDAMPAGGELVVTCYEGPRGVELEIADSGERRATATSQHNHDTSGVGMAIVRRIAQLHGGDVCTANCPEGGMALTLRFPPRRALRAAA